MLLLVFEYFDNVFYLFGLEDGSLLELYLGMCDEVVYIFILSSLNFVVMVNIVFYDCFVKSQYDIFLEGIRNSCDINNWLCFQFVLVLINQDWWYW